MRLPSRCTTRSALVVGAARAAAGHAERTAGWAAVVRAAASALVQHGCARLPPDQGCCRTAQAIECLQANYGPQDVRLARAYASLGTMHAAQGAEEAARQHFAVSVQARLPVLCCVGLLHWPSCQRHAASQARSCC